MKKVKVQEIALTGIVSSIALIFGLFAHFPLFGMGQVFLLGIIIFLIPLILSTSLALLATSIVVVMVDLFWGYLAYTWISLIAYLIAILILKFFLKILNNKFSFIVGLFFAALEIICVYYLFETIILSSALAFSDFLANLVQETICIVGAIILYYPLKQVTTQLGINSLTIYNVDMTNKQRIENIYNSPKWYYFLPLVGFVSFMKDVMKYTKGENVTNKGTKEYEVMQKFTKKFFLYLNIFLPLYFLFNILIFNIGIFIWKKPVRAAGYNLK